MYPTADRLAHLSPPQRAAFAVSSRLISCFVTESLLRAVYFPLPNLKVAGFATVFLDDLSSNACPWISNSFSCKDILAVILLQQIPIFSECNGDSSIRDISLLDPLDMIPLILASSQDRAGSQCQYQYASLVPVISQMLKVHCRSEQTATQLQPCWDPVLLWNRYAHFAKLASPLLDEISNELASSYGWQTYSYNAPPKAPLFMSPSIEWEQSIVEGHPIHPMHKTRYFLPPLPNYAPEDYNFYQATLRFAVVPRCKLKVTNDFEHHVKPIIDAASRRAGDWPAIPKDHIIMPVHELQVVHIQAKFTDIKVLPNRYTVPVLAQQSIRSVQVPDAHSNVSLKLAVGLKLTSAVRTISPASAYLGPRFSSQVVPHLHLDPNIITVAKELASVVHNHPDPEIAKHCAAIVREAHENYSDQRGERLIVATALVESGHSGEGGNLPALIRIFGLDTEEKRVDWLERFVLVFFQAFLPPVLFNGVAFECHPQNCLIRFDLETKEVRGFVIRDFGGLRVHPETLQASTGVILDCLPDHSIIAPDLDDVYRRLYHAMIHNHLQQLIRVLGLHHNGRGWEIVRKHLGKLVPKDHGLYRAWLSPESKTVLSKCFLRMRMADMYRFHLHTSIPNLIHYSGSDGACQSDLKKNSIDIRTMATEALQRRAAFAVVSRLLSCLVTERILRALYIGLTDSNPAAGFLVILSTHLMSEQPTLNRPLHACDILVIVPVHHLPVFKGHCASNHGQQVALLDPLDMLPEVYELAEASCGTISDGLQKKILDSFPPSWKLDHFTRLKSCYDPIRIWSRFVDGIVLADSLQETIRKELKSSYDWQLIAYETPPRCPTWESSTIEWEQSLVAGHPTHPMHRARMLPFEVPLYNWYRPRIRFIAIARSSLDISGRFERITRQLAEKAANTSGHALPVDDHLAIVPIHELQVHNIMTRIPEAQVLHPDISVEALAQSSLRTVIMPGLPGIAVKLAVGVKISSALRTVSHFTATFGPRFSEVIPRLRFEPNYLSVEREPASAVYRSADPDVAKHLSVILREEYQPAPDEKLIVCAALLEMDHSGSPPGIAAIQHVFQLDTPDKRAEFLDQYLRIACRALLPPLVYNGVAFEAHAQNVLVRVDDRTKSVLGFVIRDLGGIRVYPPLFRQSTGIDFRFLPGHCVAARTLEETFAKFYHTFVHNHIQRLIRVLDLHYSGVGWAMLRRYMKEVIPPGHALEKIWLDPLSTEVSSKCLLRMRMRNSYSEMVYGLYPNMIQFRPGNSDCDERIEYSRELDKRSQQ